MFFPHVLFAVPLIVLFSLVYAGTRHERPGAILNHAIRFAFGTVVFMGGIGVFLAILNYMKG